MFSMDVSVECRKDNNCFGNEYVFRHNKKVIDRCDEEDYHQTVDDLEAQGYCVRPCY